MYPLDLASQWRERGSVQLEGQETREAFSLKDVCNSASFHRSPKTQNVSSWIRYVTDKIKYVHVQRTGYRLFSLQSQSAGPPEVLVCDYLKNSETFEIGRWPSVSNDRYAVFNDRISALFFVIEGRWLSAPLPG